jgi:hypothetical protein
MEVPMATLAQSLGQAVSRLIVVGGWPVMQPVVRYATTIETIDAQTGEPRHHMITYLEEGSRWLVIARHGRRTDFVRDARANEGRIKVLHYGLWRDAHLRLTDADPQVLIDQMPAKTARQVRRLSTEPRVVEITFDKAL